MRPSRRHFILTHVETLIKTIYTLSLYVVARLANVRTTVTPTQCCIFRMRYVAASIGFDRPHHKSLAFHLKHVAYVQE